MIEIIVIGAGVVGASVGYRLARAGAAVTILDAGTVGGGTSSASYAWTNSNDKPPRAYHDLNVGGMRAHAALREEFGGAPWLHGGGCLEWATDAARRAELRRRIERLRAWGYAAEEISAARFAELEPDVDRALVADAAIAHFPEEGWLDPVVYAHAVARAAVRAGARLRTGVRVGAVRRDGGRVVGVTTDGGEAHGADVVVNCAGRWANDVAAGLAIPLAPTVGLLVLTPPVPARVRHLLRAPDCHLRPDGGGRLMIHSDDIDEAATVETRPDPSLPGCVDLARRAARVLPSIAGVRPEAARVGVRPMPADGRSAVGPIPGVSGYYLVVTHSGVTLAPHLGALVADEIVGGREDARLAPFRPARLLP